MVEALKSNDRPDQAGCSARTLTYPELQGASLLSPQHPTIPNRLAHGAFAKLLGPGTQRKHRAGTTDSKGLGDEEEGEEAGIGNSPERTRP